MCLHQCSVYRFDRPSRGGGLLLLLNSDLVVLNVYQHMIGNIQILGTTLQFNTIIRDKIDAVLVYRPLGTSSTDSMALIDYLQRQCCSELQLIPLILLGDFNLSKVDWGYFTLLYPGTPPADSNLLQQVLKNSLSQHVLMSIRGDNIFGLVFASHGHLVHNFSVALPFSTSNHNSVIFDLKGITEHSKLHVSSVVKQQLDFSKCDLVALTADLNLVDWSLIFLR